MYNINQLAEKLQLNTVQVRAYLTLNRASLKPYIIIKDGVTYISDTGLHTLLDDKETIKNIKVYESDSDNDSSSELLHENTHHIKEDPLTKTQTIHIDSINSLKKELKVVDSDIITAEKVITKQNADIKKLFSELKRKEANYLKKVIKK